MGEEHKIAGPEESRQQFSAKEYELIQQLVKTRQESSQELRYESLDGYEVPPRTQFSMLKKPAVTIKNGQINFNKACIRLFEGVQYVLPIVHEDKHKLAIIPCKEEESSSIDWARLDKEGAWTNKQITNRDLVAKIGHFMKWNTDCRYKILGEVRMSAKGLILVFELDEAIMFSSQVEEVLDEETGEVKKKKKDIKYYPEKYKGRIGMSYSDYEQTRQMNLFEDFANYFQQDGTAVETAGTESAATETTETDKPEQDISAVPVVGRQSYPIVVAGADPAPEVREVTAYGETKY